MNVWPRLLAAVLLLIAFLAAPVYGNNSSSQWRIMFTSPGVKIVSESCYQPGRVLAQPQNLMSAAQQWLAKKGLQQGRNFSNDKLLYISIGSAAINALPSEAGYIDSRFLAFQRAELEAKIKIAMVMGLDLSAARSASDRNILPKERDALAEIVHACPQLKDKILHPDMSDPVHGSRLASTAQFQVDANPGPAAADSAVHLQNRQIQPAQYAATAKSALWLPNRTISQASLKVAAGAFAEIQGTQIIQAFEGAYQNHYQVAVISLWSLNLQKLVDRIINGSAPPGIAKNDLKAAVAAQLPEQASEKACLTGVRAFIDADGEHVLLAFGQAGVDVLGGRVDKGFETAEKKATLRAMAAARQFMGETLAFDSTENLIEILSLYADEYQEGRDAQAYRYLSRFQETIQAKAQTVHLTGLQSLMSFELTHPFTQKPLVLAVMAWSPQTQAIANKLKQEMAKNPVIAQVVTSPGYDGPAATSSNQVTSSGSGADPDAW